jgi:hypothetical protein
MREKNELKNRLTESNITMRAERKVMETESKVLTEQNLDLSN